MNYYVFLQILIFQILKTVLLHERPGHPYGQFSYVQLCSWMQNLFSMFRFLNLTHGLNLNYCYFLILSWNLLSLCWSLIFLNLNWKIFRRCEMLHLPYGQFWYVPPYSLRQSLFLKFRFLNRKKIFLFPKNQNLSLSSLNLSPIWILLYLRK
jgi:hypothetical protein